MTDDLRTRIKKLKELMPQLNQLADEAAQTIRETEAALADLPIAADVVVRSTQTSPKMTDFVSLAFKRIGGKFRITIVKECRTDFRNDHGYADEALRIMDETPWLESPRDEKLETFPKLGDLLAEISKNAAKSIDAMNQAKPGVKAVLDLMK